MSSIVFHGDSVTYGVRTGVTQSDTFAQKIGNARGFSSIINTGVPGNTSSQGLARFQSDVLSHSPDAVCIMFGINDVYYNISTSDFKNNITSMVQMAKNANCRPTIITPNLVRSTPYINAFPAYLDALRSVSKATSTPIVDAYLRFEDVYFIYTSSQFDSLWADYQHPSSSGHQLIADLVLQDYNCSACS
ncbi:SGNH/GDSL hydrolase family protein [Chromobacterium rhizoryzae]|uniref:SGNH hydrolase-type esterase domain-containing protein n=1 Tax=Chromobacterium rhizoryzae TaxID=1778675 RepID=A0AAD0RQD5_9NEIS|nr:GDSL-type esterase/lipase family protein [Chromobacterium rhizoryzae]AXT46341.1 hypothetical protein D1345_09140 [Chromobacterium rhizoryzae]